MLKLRMKYLYHKLCAAVLNWQASRHSKMLRTGTKEQRREASKNLLDIGARSNAHERKRDALKEQFKA